MTDAIRAKVAQILEDNGITRKAFARSIEYSEHNFSRAMAGKLARVPDVWQRTLDALGYELTITKKRAAPPQE